MSIPLDRLYNFLSDHCDQDVLIYRWYPHGSRKIEHCAPLKHYSYHYRITQLPMICHDQEPLRFCEFEPLASKIGVFRHTVYEAFNFYDQVLMLHSEQRSTELEKFSSSGVIPVYYWSHAVIARDWYRYAQHDAVLNQKQPKQLFLVYNRAWSGTREYRLKFAELVANHDLPSHCRMSFNPWDQDQHYHKHQFVNQDFAISDRDLESRFPRNQTHSTASADYVPEDYTQTAIEIVLETLFDDQRWHLTEKSLRPIACGQPFLLAATPGSLEYLRSYGFQTFAPYIDETYDTISDPLQRLEAIVTEMQRISRLDSVSQQQLIDSVMQIARHNRERFFSPEFFQQVMDEYKHNVSQAVTQARAYHCASYFKRYRHYHSVFWSQEDLADLVEYVKNHIQDSTLVLKFF
jgi:hypothetical protein